MQWIFKIIAHTHLINHLFHNELAIFFGDMIHVASRTDTSSKNQCESVGCMVVFILWEKYNSLSGLKEKQKWLSGLTTIGESYGESFGTEWADNWTQIHSISAEKPTENRLTTNIRQLVTTLYTLHTELSVSNLSSQQNKLLVTCFLYKGCQLALF